MPIYLDNSATTHLRPGESVTAAVDFIRRVSANPGRGAYPLAVEAGRMLAGARAQLAAFFGVDDPSQVVFTRNATEAINLFLRGLLRGGDRVLVTGNEHNAVLRTLTALTGERGVHVQKVMADQAGLVNADGFAAALEQDRFAAAVVNHVSNVAGTLAPLDEIADLCAQRDVPLLIDAAQSAGTVPVRLPRGGDAALAFTSHKALMGIQGTGGLVLGNRALADRLSPLITGGTGTPLGDEEQPMCLPDKFESGTLPMPAIASLGASLEFINRTGLDVIARHKQRLTRRLFEGLSAIAGVTVYGPGDHRQIAVVSFTVTGMPCARVALRLAKAGIACRAGLHCAPSAHRALGTYPDGTVRFSVGYFNTETEIEYAVAAVKNLVGGNRLWRTDRSLSEDMSQASLAAAWDAKRGVGGCDASS